MARLRSQRLGGTPALASRLAGGWEALLRRLDLVLSVVDQGCVSAGNFATGVVLARTLPPEDFGLFVLINTGIFCLVAVQGGLLIQPFVVYGAPLEGLAFARFFRANTLLQGLFILGGGVLVALAGLIWESLRPLVAPLVLVTALLQLQEYGRRVLYTRGRMRAALVNNVVNYDLQPLLLLGAAWLAGLDLATALWLIAATSLLAVLLGAWQLRDLLGWQHDDLRTVARKSLGIGTWMAASNSLTAAYFFAFPAAVTSLAGLARTAELGVLNQVLGPLHLLTYPLDSYFLPRGVRALARQGVAGLRRIVWSAVWFVGPLYLGYIALVAAAPSWILRLIYGERYLADAEVLRLLALANALFLPVYVLELAMKARRFQRYLFLGEAWMVGISYTVGVLLIAWLGLVGAAAATAAAAIGQSLLLVALLRLASGRQARVPGGSR